MSMNEDNLANLVLRIARIGREHPQRPPLQQVAPFRFYFAASGVLNHTLLDERDGCCTPREILTRFLLLMAVLDQGPDIPGLRQMLIQVTNTLYAREVRFLHRPADFFREIGLAVDQIIRNHESIKSVRAEDWARENRSKPFKYNLFKYDRNQTKALHYAVARWGVPLLLPLFLEQDPGFALDFPQKDNPTLLLDYLESWPSAERMSKQIKAHNRYGLGKAIGDKATHLFTKWVVETFRLSRRTDEGWSPFSYEVPYDSNAGRVLWRTGYILHWLDEQTLRDKKVIQPGKGKGNTHYLRVTNLRNIAIPLKEYNPEQWALYIDLTKEYFKGGHPQKAQFQRLQHLYLLEHSQNHPDDPLTVGHFDDGLMYVGTRFCFNHDKPNCAACPLKEHCLGYQQRPNLIADYRT